MFKPKASDRFLPSNDMDVVCVYILVSAIWRCSHGIEKSVSSYSPLNVLLQKRNGDRFKVIIISKPTVSNVGTMYVGR